jgi:hypothetical protein
VRSLLPLLGVALIAACVGCGQVAPGPTVYVTVPAAQSAPTPPRESTPPATSATPAELTGPAKPKDPWEEARAYFKKVKETEKEKTEARLKAMDRVSEQKIGFRMTTATRLDVGDYPSSVGQDLWRLGFTEFVAARSGSTLDDTRFLSAFKTLNPTPTADEIINGAIQYTITYFATRERTHEAIDRSTTRDHPDTHKAAAAWSGK